MRGSQVFGYDNYYDDCGLEGLRESETSTTEPPCKSLLLFFSADKIIGSRALSFTTIKVTQRVYWYARVSFKHPLLGRPNVSSEGLMFCP